jgi:signal transduction histidine kinase
VRTVEASLPPERDDLRAQLSDIATGLAAALEGLQEISRGIHPAILSKGGLGPAVQVLAHRSTIPVALDLRTDARLGEPIEVAAYFVVSEALANAAKRSRRRSTSRSSRAAPTWCCRFTTTVWAERTPAAAPASRV